MVAVTWAVGGRGENQRAVVICNHCNAVLSGDLRMWQVATQREEIAKAHYCTPPKPWRPGRT